MSMFDTPGSAAGGDRFVNADHEGDLLIVKVKTVEEGVETSAGVSDVIVADVTVVDGAHAGERYDEAWLFGKVLVPQLKRKVGRMVLGRFVKGQAQKGKTAPWQLDPASEQDQALAERFMRESMRPDPAAPAAASTAADDDVPPWERNRG